MKTEQCFASICLANAFSFELMFQQLEDSQVTKEVKLRETSHQFAIPGEKIHKSSLAKGMAQSYETKL